MDVQTDSRARAPAPARSCSSSSARRSTSPTAPQARRLRRALRRRPGAFGPPASRPPPASATRAEPGHHHAATSGTDRRDRRPAGQGRQRPLRARLLEVHPLLQVRRGVRRRRPEHVRDRRRRARLRRAHLHRMRTSPLPDSACVYCGNCIGVCPTGRADVPVRVRACARPGTWDESAPDRRPTRSAPTAASAARSPCMSRTTGSSRSLRRWTRRSPTATCASRAASASSSSRAAHAAASLVPRPAGPAAAQSAIRWRPA